MNLERRHSRYGSVYPYGGIGLQQPVGQSSRMNIQMMMYMLTMMNMMTQMFQMMIGSSGMSLGPGQFGSDAFGGGFPLTNFLGGNGGGIGGRRDSVSTQTSTGVGGGNVDPNTVKDKAGTQGMSSAARNGLNEAHKFGLPLVSGKRNGNGKSDHDSGNAIDVGTLPIGAASSTGGTQQMKAYAEQMRQQGKAGRGNVKYVIADGRIASARNNWEWRPYTYPGHSQASLSRLKKSNPGEYNRLQHNDHVHVSFT